LIFFPLAINRSIKMYSIWFFLFNCVECCWTRRVDILNWAPVDISVDLLEFIFFFFSILDIDRMVSSTSSKAVLSHVLSLRQSITHRHTVLTFCIKSKWLCPTTLILLSSLRYSDGLLRRRTLDKHLQALFSIKLEIHLNFLHLIF
jgi:hypothetical protein